jgi:hypothetical protein
MSQSGRAVLLLDVLAQNGDRGTAHGPGEVRPGPQPFRPPVVPVQIRELLPQSPGRHAFEAVDQAGDRHGGREVHQQVHVLGFAVELGQFAPEVRAHVRVIRPMRCKVAEAEDLVSAFGG